MSRECLVLESSSTQRENKENMSARMSSNNVINGKEQLSYNIIVPQVYSSNNARSNDNRHARVEIERHKIPGIFVRNACSSRQRRRAHANIARAASSSPAIIHRCYVMAISRIAYIIEKLSADMASSAAPGRRSSSICEACAIIIEYAPL